MHYLIAASVLVALVAPFILAGRRIEKGRRRAGIEAVEAHARRSLEPDAHPTTVLPPARAITTEEHAEQRVTAWLALREARTAEVLDALERRIKRGLDELLERAFEVLEQDAIDRAWVLLGTGEHEAVSLTA